MNVLVSLVAVAGLFALGLLGAVPWIGWIFYFVIPYLAVAIFLGGMVHRVMSWANVPVPFRVPTTCGQQKSLSWIKQEKLENPHNSLTVIGRMALEVLFFRSLLRNTKTELVQGDRLVYGTSIWLWLAAMAMHWSFLIILIRHIRLFTVPVPSWVTLMQTVEGFHHLGEPVFYITTIVFLGALGYLLFRRLFSGQVRYRPLVHDYFPLFLILGIGMTGVILRHFIKTDIVAIKELGMGLLSFNPVVPEAHWLFYGYIFLVSVLFMYLPFNGFHKPEFPQNRV